MAAPSSSVELLWPWPDDADFCSCASFALVFQVLKELAPYKSLVIATGGGAVTRPKNWSYMHNGIVAWLRGEPSLLARRVVAEGIEKRPLLFGEGVSGES